MTGFGYRHKTPREYRYYPVGIASRRPLVHAMRADKPGHTACFQTPESWTEIAAATVTCGKCCRWIERVGAKLAQREVSQ